MDHDPTDPHQRTRCAPLHSFTAIPLTLATMVIRSVTFFPFTHIYKENIKPDPQHLENVIVARPTHGAQKKMSGLRSQFEPKSHSKGSTSKSAGDAEFRPPSHCTSNDMELDIHVRVERSVMVDYKDEPEHSSSWAE